MTYRRRASPLHAARAAVGAALLPGARAGVALSFEHPLVLGAVLVAVLLAAAPRAGVGAVRARARCCGGLPFALLIALDQPARRARRADGDRAARRRAAARRGRHHARGDGLRRGARRCAR